MSGPYDGTEEELRGVLLVMYKRIGAWTPVHDALMNVVIGIIGEHDISATDEEPPESVPYGLTEEQRISIRFALFWMRERPMRWSEIAKYVGYSERFITAFNRGTVAGSMHFAACVAEAARVKLADLLAGRVT